MCRTSVKKAFGDREKYLALCILFVICCFMCNGLFLLPVDVLNLLPGNRDTTGHDPTVTFSFNYDSLNYAGAPICTWSTCFWTIQMFQTRGMELLNLLQHVKENSCLHFFLKSFCGGWVGVFLTLIYWRIPKLRILWGIVTKWWSFTIYS